MSADRVLPTIITTTEGADPEQSNTAAVKGGEEPSESGIANSANIAESNTLQVSPSSPSASSPLSVSLNSKAEANWPLYPTTERLGIHQQSGHDRKLSCASALTDQSGYTNKMNHSEKDAVVSMPDSRGGQSSGGKDQVNKGESSRWALLKAKVKGHTRAGRVAAQAKALEEEKNRMRDMDPTPFSIRPTDLADLVDPKSVAKLRDLGGLDKIMASLGTDAMQGLDYTGEAPSSANRPDGWVIAGSQDRERVFGRNVLPEKKGKSLLLLMWLALQDRILILLIVAAIISLALGLYTDLGAPPELIPCENPPPGQEECELPSVDWVEGLAILVAVAIVDIVGSLNDWQKERQFKLLNAKKEERNVKVIRQGSPMLISVHDVQVGDICQVEPGEIIPCDGIFLRGHNVKVDESSATGESDMIRKLPYEECLQDLIKAENTSTKAPNRDCFLISGSRCLEGAGDYCIIAVGPMSFNGKLLMSLQTDSEMTPLQAKLNRLAEIIAYCGTAAGVILFFALMIRFFVQLARPIGGIALTANEKAQNFIDILISAVVIIVVAVPEGLPLATTLALAFATKRMTKENLLVRMLSACETSANVSVVCTDKTGTLTQNEMSVVAGSIGVNLKFALDLQDNQGRVDQEEKHSDWVLEQKKLGDHIDGTFRQLINDAITVNSTAFEEAETEESEEKAADLNALDRLKKLFGSKEAATKKSKSANNFVGSKTETALLNMAKDLGWEDYRTARARNEVVTSFPFSSERKAMAIVVKKPNGGCRLFVKGASEILTKLCSHHVEVDRDSQSKEIASIPFTEEAKENVSKTIMFYANQTLRTIALCYKDFESWPPQEAVVDEDGEVSYESLAKEMTLIAVTAIEDPLRPEVKDAVATCAKAGVQVKMCTGDNILTARSIATQCGIFTPDGVIMEGPVFRNLSTTDMMEVVPKLQVLARCSPEDKKILVECLKTMDNIVAVTGDGTNDAPALKTANVGFSMGIAGTEVAREASDIILMDDNFESIVTAIQWGRCVNDAVARFLSFQLAVNVGAVAITFITAVASEDEKAVFTAVQLLWINLIMDTLAALALATDPASPELLDRKPTKRNAPLITVDMWKMIIGQAIYQITFILVLNFAGKQLLNLDSTDPIEKIRQEDLLRSLIFNAFVFCQIFNSVNCRSLNRDLNIFKGLHRNMWFISIILIEIGLQILISYKGGAAFSLKPIHGREWAISIISGLITWPIGVLIRLIPTAPIEKFLIKLGLYPDPNALPVHRYLDPDKINDYEGGELAKELATELSAFAQVRGGRSKMAFLGKSRNRRLEEANVHPGRLLALVPGLISSGIVADWKSPHSRQGDLAE